MDHEDEDLQMALRMSMNEPPEPKRSKPRENSIGESPKSDRKSQRELMAAAAEKRMMAMRGGSESPSLISKVEKAEISERVGSLSNRVESKKESVVLGSEISAEEARLLFSMDSGHCELQCEYYPKTQQRVSKMMLQIRSCRFFVKKEYTFWWRPRRFTK